MTRVAVIGGGLAGLVAAYELAGAGVTVTLLDGAATLGGQIRTRREAGFVVEDGAEGFVASDRDVPELCRVLGLGDQLVPQVERRSLLLRDGTLSPLSPGEAAALLGIQASDEDLGRGIMSLRDGMGSLGDSLVTALSGRVSIETRRPVTGLVPTGEGWRLESPEGPHAADAVVLAAEPRAAARLLASIAPEAAQALGAVSLMSNLSVSTAYPRATVSHPLDASGIVVSPTERATEGLRACAFSSSKFPNRAPGGSVLLRSFFRPEEGQWMAADGEWLERVARVLGPLLGIRGAPTRSWVARWPHALPLYGPAHGRMVEAATRSLRAVGPLELAGSAYHPGGVPGAVRSGRLAARRLLDLPAH